MPFPLVLRASALLALVAVVSARPSARPADDAGTLARRIQERYDRVRDFSAAFVHTYESGALRRKSVERGTVLIKKPGRMRWTYTSPERKTFVSDGRKIYSYIPADRQVIVGTMPEGDQASTAVLFLAGKGSLLRDFTASESAEFADAATAALKLVPRRPEPEYEWLVVRVDRGTLGLRGLVSADGAGGRSAIAFTQLKENVGLSDKEFVFTIPRGVDVITHEPDER